ncbi:uncharacterized protein LOC131637683 [Vicia villosa]|uniref:uncharacterized protein LOC131637683 n=1 Tax=Vicia villosa TaxID=3911 RepID=UPI00273AD97D|nr:uncharacterized protein LOC131637683 [Vicia villosa]
MSFGHGSSSSAKNKSDLQVYSSSNLLWNPFCRCGDSDILRRARTLINYGKLFWGCQHFKRYNNVGCGFFEWFYEEGRDEKEEFMMKQQSKIDVLTKEIDEAKKSIQDVIIFIVFQFIIFVSLCIN